MLWKYGNKDVQPLAAGGFDEALQAEGCKALADLERACSNGLPRNGFVGIKVDGDAVRLLKALIAGSPGMDF